MRRRCFGRLMWVERLSIVVWYGCVQSSSEVVLVDEFVCGFGMLCASMSGCVNAAMTEFVLVGVSVCNDKSACSANLRVCVRARG